MGLFSSIRKIFAPGDGEPALVVNDEEVDQPARHSPRITHIAWGEMRVEGVGAGRDFKLYPGGGRSWDWKETNTHHVPGIQPADVQELLDHGSEFVVLSSGMQLALQTAPETIKLLQSLQVEFRIAETKKAVELYNRLVQEGKAVGGLFHSTC